MIEVRAPGRVDLAGGTLDLWPLYCLHPGSVTVNVAIESGARVAAEGLSGQGSTVVADVLGRGERRLGPEDIGDDLVAAVVYALVPEGGVRIVVREQLPVGSGLGGSSVLAVAVARACLAVTGRNLEPGRLVAILRDVEARTLQAPTGVQDYYPALLGGVLAIAFAPGGEAVTSLDVSPAWIDRHLVVVYTGITHHSGMVNWEVYRRRLDGDSQVAVGLDEIAAAGRCCREALVAADEEGVAAAMRKDWQARRRLAPGVTTPDVDAVVAAGLAAGALAGKACGAGGGGCIAFWTPPGSRIEVAEAAVTAAGSGARVIPARVVGNDGRSRMMPTTTA